MTLANKDAQIILKFGGGLHVRASETSIVAAECADGKNFELDVGNTEFRRRRAIHEAATAPNGNPVRGFAQLVKSDDTRSFLVQAGDTVYEWDGTSGSSGMTDVASVNPGARLRGPISANSVKDDIVIITDLEKVETVKQWDGTTFQALAHNLGGDFFAKYCLVADERAYYANVTSGGTDTPHLLVGSKRDDLDNLNVTNRPSSSLAVGDPFFLPMPNLRPINGLLEAFGRLIVPTRRGLVYQLTGSDATDYALGKLLVTGGVTGDEGMVLTDNDVLFSTLGAVEKIIGTDRFGDVETDEVSRWIQPLLQETQSFTLVYSPRFRKAYAIPVGGGKVYVLNESVLHAHGAVQQAQLSPWSVWTTTDGFNFEPTAAALMLRPTDGQEFVYLGGADGSIYQLESGMGADPGSNTIVSERLSGAYTIPPADLYDVEGWVKYREIFSGTLTLTFEWGGENLFDRSLTVTMDAAGNAPVFGGNVYFGGSVYFNSSFNGGRLRRKRFGVPGRSDQLQVRASVTGSADFFIEEIGLTLRAVA